ncbi:Modular serine protease [Eumeta japonica]|uniref:Modular serine protease n=1 Tax=Eumeta variegata TaxID=151549 RepID=A0A4C1UXZ5_EUMVA|nr:Modular serine protease [Eumeta japonica]
MDNWFTSFPLIDELPKDYKLTTWGTVRKNKPKGRELNGSVFAFRANCTLVSCISKKRKVVFLPSTMHHDAKIDESFGEAKKPEMITDYNRNKCGVDVFDELCGTYSVPRITKRRPMVLFFSLMNIGGINAYVIVKSNKENLGEIVSSRRDHLKELTISLVMPHVRSRSTILNMPENIKIKLLCLLVNQTKTTIRVVLIWKGHCCRALKCRPHAAHCFWSDVEGLAPSSRFAVAAGKLYRPWSAPSDHGAQLRDVKDIVIPKRFRGAQTNFQDDIAIVYVSNPLSFNPDVWPVCVDFDLKMDRAHLTAGNLGKVAGWGLIDEDGHMSPELQVLRLPYVEIDQCITNASPDFRAYISSDKICAGYTNGTALCKGDSGGGLVFAKTEEQLQRYYLRGVASTAPNNDKKCNTHAVPTFTHILAHEHFIKDHLNLTNI